MFRFLVFIVVIVKPELCVAALVLHCNALSVWLTGHLGAPLLYLHRAAWPLGHISSPQALSYVNSTYSARKMSSLVLREVSGR